MRSKNSLTTQIERDSEDSMINKEEFLDQIHELKNQLTVICGGSQLVALQLKQALEKYEMLKHTVPPDFLENLDLIHKAVLKTKKLILNLDDDYQIDRKKET